MRPIALATIAALALLPGAAFAAASTAGGVTGDVRCLMSMAALSGSKDAAQARLGQVGVVYFAGRVKAQDPSYDFGVRLKPVAATLNRDAIASEAKRCGPMLTASLRELDNAQKAMGPAQTPQAKPAAKAPAKP